LASSARNPGLNDGTPLACMPGGRPNLKAVGLPSAERIRNWSGMRRWEKSAPAGGRRGAHGVTRPTAMGARQVRSISLPTSVFGLNVCAERSGSVQVAKVVARLQRLIPIMVPYPGRCPGRSYCGLSGLPCMVFADFTLKDSF
jgi:hypothetical protein